MKSLCSLPHTFSAATTWTSTWKMNTTDSQMWPSAVEYLLTPVRRPCRDAQFMLIVSLVSHADGLCALTGLGATRPGRTWKWVPFIEGLIGKTGSQLLCHHVLTRSDLGGVGIAILPISQGSKPRPGGPTAGSGGAGLKLPSSSSKTREYFLYKVIDKCKESSSCTDAPANLLDPSFSPVGHRLPKKWLRSCGSDDLLSHQRPGLDQDRRGGACSFILQLPPAFTECHVSLLGRPLWDTRLQSSSPPTLKS